MELEGCLSRVYGGTERAGSVTEQSKVNRQQEKSRGKRELPLPPKKSKDKELENRMAVLKVRTSFRNGML